MSGSDLYVGGAFTTATNSDGTAVAVNGIAKWNGSTWSALGLGVDGFVKALVVSGSNLYAGCSFATAGGSPAICIAKWNGSSWLPLGLGTDSGVWALALSGSDLYVGGTFTTVINSDGSTVTVNKVAKWNGSSWSALGSEMYPGVMYSGVYALAVSGGNLYAGGDFYAAGGVAVNNIAK